jgi:hypothetical protein
MDRWKVTRFGLESSGGYSIAKEDLGEVCQHKGGGKLSEWITHLSGRNWFDADAFEGPFREALKRHKVEATFDIDLSLYHARVRRACHRLHDAVADRLNPAGPDGFRMMRFSDMGRVSDEVSRLMRSAG